MVMILSTQQLPGRLVKCREQRRESCSKAKKRTVGEKMSKIVKKSDKNTNKNDRGLRAGLGLVPDRSCLFLFVSFVFFWLPFPFLHLVVSQNQRISVVLSHFVVLFVLSSHSSRNRYNDFRFQKEPPLAHTTYWGILRASTATTLQLQLRPT